MALGVYTFIQALFQAFESRDSEYIMQYKTNNAFCLTYLFFAQKRLLALLEQFLETILANYTYKTNQFCFLFFVMIGVTSLNMTFYVAFAFLPYEEEGDYVWALSCLCSLYRRF